MVTTWSRSRIETRRGFARGRSGIPPSLTIVSLPPLVALSTATRCWNGFVPETVTLTTGVPIVSSFRRGSAKVRCTRPAAVSHLPPPVARRTSLLGLGKAANCALPVNGLFAISTRGCVSIPFGSPLRKRSNHVRSSRLMWTRSGEVPKSDGAWPKSPR